MLTSREAVSGSRAPIDDLRDGRIYSSILKYSPSRYNHHGVNIFIQLIKLV